MTAPILDVFGASPQSRPSGDARGPRSWKHTCSSFYVPRKPTDEAALAGLETSRRLAEPEGLLVPELAVVLLLGERNDGAWAGQAGLTVGVAQGALTATALSRVRKAWALCQAADSRARCGSFLAAGSGIGSHFNRSDTLHYELLRRQLRREGMPGRSWIAGWPSEHTVLGR